MDASTTPPPGPPPRRAHPARPGRRGPAPRTRRWPPTRSGRKIPTVETLDRVVRAAGFELDVELSPSVGGPDPGARGKELVEVLELAALFPARHRDTLVFPPVRTMTGLPARSCHPRGARRGRRRPRVRRGAGAGVVHPASPGHDRHRRQRVRRRAAAPRGAAALPAGVAWRRRRPRALDRDGQARLWWDTTPVDVFLNTTDFHRQVGDPVPVGGLRRRRACRSSSCADLAVFKAFFNRTKDWADLEEMRAAGTLDLDRVIGVLVRYLGRDDERIDRLLALG